MSFAHLHLHTLYSLLDGAIRMNDLMVAVKEKGMDSVAVTDHGNMYGAVDFFLKAKAAGVKPVFGMEAYVAGPKGREDRSEQVNHHLVLLAKNEEGFANLRRLSSMAFIEGFYYHPRIDKPLLKKHSKGLIGLSACLGGEIGQAMLREDLGWAKRAALEYKDIFEPGSYFLEIQSNGMVEQERMNDHLKQLSRDLKLPLVATADAHYIRQEDAKAHELLMCIASGKTLSSNTRRHSTDRLYVMSPQEMRAYFSDVPEAVDNTLRIAELCNVELSLGKTMLPNFQVPEGHDADSFMKELAHRGLRRRFEQLPKAVDREAYGERLDRELSVICSMGFSGYFLIVQDFINWAKQQGIPVGPGRGSGAGSLVAFALGITDLDPIPYHLLFERFLNPERVSMPDFDIDFCQYRRDEVIQYVSKKYGENNVGQIITFGSLKAKSVLRDVCRVYGLPYNDGDRLAKLIPGLLNITLKQSIFGDTSKGISGEERLKEMVDSPTMLKNAEGVEVVSTKEVLEVGMALEGLHRQAGMHAAGIVIADKPLWEYVPVCRPSGETVIVTQFAKDEVEAAGLVKFDFLGLKTLTVIEQALKLINQNRPGQSPLTTDNIPLDDPKIFELISSGDTAGVFQMESSGFTDMVMKLRPSCFEDVIAAGALYRPGPLDAGMVDTFINRKHGREEVAYPHPKLEPVLKETYGVIVYQEQVMQISQILGGYSLGRADLLRRAMGKKKVDVMAKERAVFLEGCVKNGVDMKLAGEIFDMMETFAEYGFNKSHSAAYGLITIQTAWLKAHHPLEFTAALLTSEKDNTDKVVSYIAKARTAGREVLPPDVNNSLEAFSVVDGKIRFGLGAIKGIGAAAIEAILEVRAQGPFGSLMDFCSRADGRRVNKRVVEALVKAGAFDFERRPRKQLFENVVQTMERGAKLQKELSLGQGSLFEDLGTVVPPKRLLAEAEEVVEEWPERVRLGFEKEAIGFYVSGHPLQQYEKEAELFATPTSQVALVRRGEKITVAGVVASLRERPTKTGKRMAWLRIEDLHGSIDAVCFPGKSGGGEQERSGRWTKSAGRLGYETWEPLLKSDEALLFRGTVQWDESDEEAPPVPEIFLEEVQSLKEVQADRLNRLELKLEAESLLDEKLHRLKQLIESHPGKTPLRLTIRLDGEAEVSLKPAKNTVEVNEVFLEGVKRLFGASVHWN
ncbi:MAG: DNA polymerase III subunit alpha [Proteobacteria bacterium]|nr:DNA polymerase III subunit alpha [Cystobacterineae bacterium]MCL2314226.1 DNA polymerase III subunit alpha [Pseudomonadota bacterium]